MSQKHRLHCPTAVFGFSRRLRSWSLRARLIMSQVMLLVVLCAFFGVGTVLALRHFLFGQLDEEVGAAGARGAAIYDVGPPPSPLPSYLPPVEGPGPFSLSFPGQRVGALAAVVEGAQVTEAAVISADGSRIPLSGAACTRLASVPATGFVTMYIDGLGEYRLVSTPTHHSVRMVTGLPTSGVSRIVASARTVFLVIGVSGLTVGALVSFLIIRRQLAPLSQVAVAAQHVAELDLMHGDVNVPTAIVHVGSDRADTEVGRLATALNRMLERIADALAARQASETRARQFVADASHELRTPLAAIRGYAELAQRAGDGLNGDAAHAIRRVDSEARRMTGLVEDMLLLARLDAGRSLRWEPVDLSMLSVDAVSDAHISAPEHHWMLDLPEEPVVVNGDDARLHQVLVNLLSNGRIHTPAGTTITVSLRRTEGGGAQVSVTDDGPGIPETLQSEIFERFARGDTSRSRRGGSSGLGLSIAAAIVNAHRGAIAVTSVPGQTTFLVTLPGVEVDSHVDGCA